MKKKVVIGLAVLLLFIPGMTLAGAPQQIGGFVLDQDIKKFEDRVIMGYGPAGSLCGKY